MNAIIMRARAELTSRIRSLVALTLILGVAGGVVLFAVAGARRTDSVYRRLIDWARPPDVLVSSGGFGFGRVDLGKAAELPQIASSAKQYQVGFYPATPSGRLDAIGGGGGAATAGVRDQRLLGRVKVLKGRRADPNRIGEVEVGLASEYFTHVRVGTHLVLHFWNPGVNPLQYYRGSLLVPLHEVPPNAFAFSLPVTVVGITVSPGDFPQIGPFGDVTLTPAFYRAYGSRTLVHSSLAAKLRRGGADMPAFRRSIEELASGGPPQLSAIEDTVAPIQRSIQPQAVALWLFAGLAALAGIVVFTQALARQNVLDSSENPTLQSLGMTGGQLFGVAMIRTALVGAASAGVAVLLALALSPLSPIGDARVAEPYPGFAADAAVLGLGGGAIVILALLVGILPAWGSARARAGALGLTEMPDRARASVTVSAAARSGLPPSVVAGVRMAVEPGRGRTATPVRSALIGTTFAVAALVTAFGFAASFEHLFHSPRLSGWNWDLAAGIPFTGDLSKQLLPPLEASPVVGQLSGANDSTTVEVVSQHGDRASTGAMGVLSVRGGVHPTMLSGRWPRSQDEIALGASILRALHAAPGEEMTVHAGGRAASMRIVGTAAFINAGGTSTSPGDGAGMTLRGLQRLYPKVPVNIFLIKLAPGVSPRHGAKAVAAIANRAHVGILPISVASGLDDLRPVRGLPIILAAVLALAAAATLAHALVTSIRRRRRDLAILKTLGFVRRQVSATVAWQATTLAVVALLVGLPLGIAAGRWAWTLFAGQLGVAAEPVVGLWAILLAVPATALVANLVAAIPGRLAARTQPALTLRSE